MCIIIRKVYIFLEKKNKIKSTVGLDFPLTPRDMHFCTIWLIMCTIEKQQTETQRKYIQPIQGKLLENLGIIKLAGWLRNKEKGHA